MFGFSRKPPEPAPAAQPARSAPSGEAAEAAEAADGRLPGNAPLIPVAYIGEIRQFAFAHAPVGWHKCDGTLLRIDEHLGLYAVICLEFGGDGNHTFALPTIPPTPEGIHSCIALEGYFPNPD